MWEIIDNSIDERLAGFATKIEVTINEDGSVTVQDDGRGIPVDIQEKLVVQHLKLSSLFFTPAVNLAVADIKFQVVCTV